MKQFLILLFFINSFVSLADAWDNLTYSEAEKVTLELKKNPFIFNYCDCCDNTGEYATTIEFLKVTKTQIVECEWNSEMYSVKITSQVISLVEFTSKGANTNQLSKYEDNDYKATLFMNYTWGLNNETHLATPYFNIVDYFFYGDDNEPCLEEFKFPTPKQLSKIQKVRGYKKWWKANIKN